MTENTTKGRIDQIDPAALTVGTNVRRDATVDKEFVASVKQHGVLQPPMVIDNGEGGYEIVFGHRRVLAAIEAGLSSIDVYLVEKHEAETARLVDQLTENDQRQQLSDAERLGGYKQLALFGLSPAQIAKSTARPRAEIDTAMAIVDAAPVLAAITEHQVTLDQAAQMVEFADDPSTVKSLTKAAEKEPEKFAHRLNEARNARLLDAHLVELRAELANYPGEVLPESQHEYSMPDGYVSASRLAHPDTLQTLDEAYIVGQRYAAPRLVIDTMHVPDVGYKKWARIQWLALKDHPDAPAAFDWSAARQRRLELEGEEPGEQPSPEQLAEQQEREAERTRNEQARVLRVAALQEAAAVRKEWLVALLQRPKLPVDADALAVAALISASGYFYDWEINPTALELLGITVDETEGSNYDASEEHVSAIAARNYINGKPINATRFLLALAFDQAETVLRGWHGRTYDTDTTDLYAAAYLAKIAEWGYNLSDAERDYLNGTAAALELAQAEADTSDDTTTDDIEAEIGADH